MSLDDKKRARTMVINVLKGNNRAQNYQSNAKVSSLGDVQG